MEKEVEKKEKTLGQACWGYINECKNTHYSCVHFLQLKWEMKDARGLFRAVLKGALVPPTVHNTYTRRLFGAASI